MGIKILDNISNDEEYSEEYLSEAIENIALANAIKEGMQSDTIKEAEFLNKLKNKIESL